MSREYLINRHYKISIYLLISFLLPAFFSCSHVEDSDKKPNIVLIVADDLGYNDVTCYNPKSGIPSPNIDKLAGSGIRFTDAHASSSYDLPSRYAIQTGQYGYRLDMLKLTHDVYGPPLIDLQRLTLPALMQRAGYVTYMSGKWNLGIRWNLKGAKRDSINLSIPVLLGVTEFGFDQAFYTSGSSLEDPPFFFVSNKHINNLPKGYSQFAYEDNPVKNTWVSPEWLESSVDTVFVQKARKYINLHCENNPDQPFFLYFAPYAPRAPYHVPEFARNKSNRGPRGDLCWLFDWMAGEIVACLKENNVFNETIIIVTSDNGPVNTDFEHIRNSEQNIPLASIRGKKGQIYEGGHRVPFVITWPDRIESGQICDEVICHTDIMATLGAITGQKMTYYDAEDSYNISNILFGEKYLSPMREATVHHGQKGLLALRRGKWKVVYGDQEYSNENVIMTSNPGMVFDLSQDQYEKNNLWHDRQDVVKNFQIILDQYVVADRSAPILNGEDEKRIRLEIPE
jgi:arylsulfatase A-like enzyme